MEPQRNNERILGYHIVIYVSGIAGQFDTQGK